MEVLHHPYGEAFLLTQDLPLPVGYEWAVAATLRDADDRIIDQLQASLEGSEPTRVRIGASEARLLTWPRPERDAPVLLYFDYQIRDMSGDTVMSSPTVQLVLEYNREIITDLVTAEVARLPTQYREAVKLRGYLRAVLGEVEEAARVTARMAHFFDIRAAVGEQLTFIGQWMGFPRRHCVCVSTPVFGFVCDDSYPRQLTGFCEPGDWLGCDGGALGEIRLDDDELYRTFLLARRYQMLALFDRDSLLAAIRTIWGPDAWIVEAERGSVVVAPGRPLGPEEAPLLQIIARVLPVAPGITLKSWLDSRPMAGFGKGFAGFCEISATKVAGFDCGGTYSYQMAGFCDPEVNWADCLPRGKGVGVWLCPDEMKLIC